ncbi:MAG: ATP-binding protein [Acidimicrobiia bacterium]
MDISICFPADSRELHAVRATVAGWLAGEGLLSPIADEFVLIASELATNAIQVSQGPDSEVRLTAWREAHCIAMDVDDDGPGFEAGVLMAGPNQLTGLKLPPPSAVRGRGLPIVEAFVHSFSVSRHGGRTIVHVERTLVPNASCEE